MEKLVVIARNGLLRPLLPIPDGIVLEIRDYDIEDDPDDDLILGCAVGAKADYLVSGDTHLRKLRDYKGIQIISPSEFLAALRE